MLNGHHTARVLSLCSGIGALDLALAAFGSRTIRYIEKAPNARAVLRARIASGDLHAAPIDEDVRAYAALGPLVAAFSGTKGHPLIVAGGIPCQGNSVAGSRKGKRDDRNLWPDMLKIVEARQPDLVFIENVRGLLSVNRATDGKHLPRMFGSIIAGLHRAGYDAVWTTRRASEAGAPHKRDRVFVLGIRRPSIELFVDPVHGNDEWFGDRDRPLKTFAELERRSKNNTIPWTAQRLAERLSCLDRRRLPIIDDVARYDESMEPSQRARAWPWPRTEGLRQHPGEVPRITPTSDYPKTRLGRGPRLQLLGNAVVPQQAVLAIESIIAFCLSAPEPGESIAQHLAPHARVARNDVKITSPSTPLSRRALKSWSPAGAAWGGQVYLLAAPLAAPGAVVDENGALWPTPDASAANARESVEKFEERRRAWREREPTRNGNGQGTPLGIAVKQFNWTTPTASLGSGGSRRGQRGANAEGGPSLAEQVEGHNWTTPNARDGRRSGSYPADKKRKWPPLPSLVAPDSNAVGSLSPTWVETLMGLPPGWTDAPAVRASERKRQDDAAE